MAGQNKQTFTDRMKTLREEGVDSAGTRWTREEDDTLANYVSRFVEKNEGSLLEDKNFAVLAKKIKRTPKAIMLRNFKNARMYINDHSASTETAASYFGIANEDLEEFIKSAEIKEERAKERSANKKEQRKQTGSPAITKEDFQELMANVLEMKTSIQRLTLEVSRLGGEVSNKKILPSPIERPAAKTPAPTTSSGKKK